VNTCRMTNSRVVRRYLECTLTIAQSRVMAIVDGEVCLIFITAPRKFELELSLQLRHEMLRVLSAEMLVTTY